MHPRSWPLKAETFSAQVREWSLITGRGGGYTTGGGGGGQVEVLPLQKGGGGCRASFSHAEGGGGHPGGHTLFLGSFNMGARIFSHTHGGRGAKSFILRFSHVVASLPVINDKSLKTFRKKRSCAAIKL